MNFVLVTSANIVCALRTPLRNSGGGLREQVPRGDRWGEPQVGVSPSKLQKHFAVVGWVQAALV